MTLQEKLHHLTLTTMAQNLETMTAQAAHQNLSFAAALERLADLELEARRQRAEIRRRGVRQAREEAPVAGKLPVIVECEVAEAALRRRREDRALQKEPQRRDDEQGEQRAAQPVDEHHARVAERPRR